MASFSARVFHRSVSGLPLSAVLVLGAAAASAEGAKVRHHEVRAPSQPSSAAPVAPSPAAPVAPSSAAPVAPSTAAPVAPSSPGSPGTAVGAGVSPPPIPGPPPAQRPALPDQVPETTTVAHAASVDPQPAVAASPVPTAQPGSAPATPASPPPGSAPATPASPPPGTAPATPEEPNQGASAPVGANRAEKPASRTRHNGVHDPGRAPAMPPRFAHETGEWVFTNDYGWIWIPKDVAVVSANNNPYVYLYTPYYGWSWYVSPWGYGPYSCGDWAFRSAIGLAFWADHRQGSVSHHDRPRPSQGPVSERQSAGARAPERLPAPGRGAPQMNPVERGSARRR